MGRNREPISLLEARGKSHMSRAEVEERRAREPQAGTDHVAAPAYLTAKQKKEFDRLAALLMEAKLLTDLDCDELARYISAQAHYVEAEKAARKIVKLIREDSETYDSEVERELAVLEAQEASSKLQKRWYDQAAASAKALGLNITSRCRIEIPKPPEKPVNRFLAQQRQEG